jgi:molybdopterin converting factor small subunit
MSKATIRIPTPLRGFTAGAAEVPVEAATVGAALQALERSHGGILARVLDEEGRVRGFVNVFLGDRNVKALSGLDTALEDAAVISIVPAVAGGGR